MFREAPAGLKLESGVRRRATIRRGAILVINGPDGERGWIVVIHEDTGRMSAVVSGDGEGFAVFGQCVLP